MINLMPPLLREQLAYSKRNSSLISYWKLIILIFGIAAALLVITSLYLRANYNRTVNEFKEKQTKIDSYKSLEAKANNLEKQLTDIKKIQTNQIYYSTFFQELANLIPRDAHLINLSLTNEINKPAKLSIIADSYESIGAFRNSLANFPSVKGVDIVNISNASGDYRGDLSMIIKLGNNK